MVDGRIFFCIIFLLFVVPVFGVDDVFLYNLSSLDKVSVDELQDIDSIDATLRVQYQPDRSVYGIGVVGDRYYDVVDVFVDLPPLPDDFWRFKYLLMSGRMSLDYINSLDSRYFLQPEFFLNTWVNSGLNIYRFPDVDHWTSAGYGTFPHTIVVVVQGGGSSE